MIILVALGIVAAVAVAFGNVPKGAGGRIGATPPDVMAEAQREWESLRGSLARVVAQGRQNGVKYPTLVPVVRKLADEAGRVKTTPQAAAFALRVRHIRRKLAAQIPALPA